ncbi:LLM class flavin-dependent oxidoreductase (plasmid) [Novosphingobium sp. BL-8A]|uniref:LLM class flavin-dependent oxidoreductase n=1 Tax=Novosphingobium sp. BL-8A TaxID=3127639 RepID=UPI003756703B
MFASSLSFDMRSAPFGTSHAELYAEALDMIAYADENGIENVTLSEHHASEDGYIPVPSLLAAAAGGRTERIAITLGAIVLPLHDPVKIAEQIAVTDLICQGRLHTILVAGCARHEFAAFRRSFGDRGELLDHGLEILVRALAGERFMDGDREVFVRPLPPGQPKLLVGGGVRASALRAARFGLGFWPMNEELLPVYHDACRDLGRSVGPIMTTAIGVHVAEDVEQGWNDIGPYILHQMREYARISGSADDSHSPMHGLLTMEAVRASGVVQVVTPPECAELASRGPIALLPLTGGLPPAIGWKSLELFVGKALPLTDLQ